MPRLALCLLMLSICGKTASDQAVSYCEANAVCNSWIDTVNNRCCIMGIKPNKTLALIGQFGLLEQLIPTLLVISGDSVKDEHRPFVCRGVWAHFSDQGRVPRVQNCGYCQANIGINQLYRAAFTVSKAEPLQRSVLVQKPEPGMVLMLLSDADD